MAEGVVQSLRDTIDQKIAGSTQAVLDRVINQLTDAETERRAKIIVTGLNAIRELEADLNKVNRADVTHYTETGAVAAQHYTKDRLAAVRKAKEGLIKLQFAMTKALSEHATGEDYSKLEKAIKTKGTSVAEAEDV